LLLSMLLRDRHNRNLGFTLVTVGLQQTTVFCILSVFSRFTSLGGLRKRSQRRRRHFQACIGSKQAPKPEVSLLFDHFMLPKRASCMCIPTRTVAPDHSPSPTECGLARNHLHRYLCAIERLGCPDDFGENDYF
jgi:hypothetical protein